MGYRVAWATVSHGLPCRMMGYQVPYLTLADKYTLFCFVVVLGVGVETALVGFRNGECGT